MVPVPHLAWDHTFRLVQGRHRPRQSIRPRRRQRTAPGMRRHCRPDRACALVPHLVPARNCADIPRKPLWHNGTRNADKRDYVNLSPAYCIECIIRPSLRRRFGTSTAVCRPSAASGEARFCVPATRYQSHTVYRAYAAYRESCQDAGREHRLQAGFAVVEAVPCSHQ